MRDPIERRSGEMSTRATLYAEWTDCEEWNPQQGHPVRRDGKGRGVRRSAAMQQSEDRGVVEYLVVIESSGVERKKGIKIESNYRTSDKIRVGRVDLRRALEMVASRELQVA